MQEKSQVAFISHLKNMMQATTMMLEKRHKRFEEELVMELSASQKDCISSRQAFLAQTKLEVDISILKVY